ncbi:MAG: hypothetical protein ACJAUL_000386 [Paraglaciecola sp.]|jgi:hypothetical protein
MIFSSILSDIFALFLLWLFMRAGMHKINRANATFYADLLVEYGLNNKPLASTVSYLIGWVEIVIGLSIMFPPSRPFAAVAAFLMLVIYLLGMLRQLYLGRVDLNCGCAGPDMQIKIGPALIVRNTILAAVSLICLFPGIPVLNGVWFIVVMTAVFLIILYSSSEKLIENNQIINVLRTR